MAEGLMMGFTLPALVYIACFVASALCAGLLVRQYLRRAQPILLWSGACFVLLAASNLIVVIDQLFLPEANLREGRLWLTLLAISILLYGFIWEAERS
jgi:hypothetical protein